MENVILTFCTNKRTVHSVLSTLYNIIIIIITIILKFIDSVQVNGDNNYYYTPTNEK